MDSPRWIWQKPDWPQFHWQAEAEAPLLRAGMAHFWFVTLHPFEDGNGRLTLAITDLALAQAEHQAIRFHTMSASILADRAAYYRVLESSQKANLDITAWLHWFLTTLLNSLQEALQHIDRVLAKARFWQQHQHDPLIEQIRLLNRLLDDGDHGFEHGISAARCRVAVALETLATAWYLADLLDKGCIGRLPGGGRSTRYQIKSDLAPSHAGGAPLPANLAATSNG